MTAFVASVKRLYDPLVDSPRRVALRAREKELERHAGKCRLLFVSHGTDAASTLLLSSGWV